MRKVLNAVPWWGWILMLVALEGALRLALFPPSQAETLGQNGQEYQRLASNLIHHGAFSEASTPPYYPAVVRTPGYPAFLAPFDWIGAWHPGVAQVAQFGVVAGTALMVGVIGRETVGPRAGTLAAVLCATYLPFLWFATQFMTEDLATFCVTLVVVLLLLARRFDSLRSYAAAGLALAVLTYVRPDFGLLAVPIAAVLLVERRGASWRSATRWSRLLAFGAVFAIAIVPWTVRNFSVTGGRVIPMATGSGSDLLASADQYSGFITNKFTLGDQRRYQTQVDQIAPTHEHAERLDAPAQVHVDDQLRSAAIRIFKSLSIGKIIGGIPKRDAYLWSTADSPPPGRWTHAAHNGAQLQYALLVLLGLAGLVLRRRRLLHDWPLWITAAYLTVAHLAFHIEARYSLPARPPLMIYSSVGLLGLVPLLQRLSMRRQELSRA